MEPVTIVLIVIAAALAAFAIFLFIFGRKAKKRQDEQQAQIERTAQPVNILVIDKKKLNIKKSGLPPEVISQANWFMKLTKLPIVKAKMGPRMVTLMCDPEVFKIIPVKKEVKATISGLYISSIRGLHGKIERPVKKQGFMSRLLTGRKG